MLCFTKHHLNQSKLKQIYIENYTLGTSYSRLSQVKGGVCIFIHNTLKFSKIGLDRFCQNQNIGICTLKIKINLINICITAVYRAPTGNFNQFINSLDTVLRKLYTPASQFIICGDININYLTDNEKKNQLNALLLLYNLSSIVDFPTRIQNKSATIINNIFIDINRMDNYTVKPLFNDLSDHDAQLLTFNNIKVQLYKLNFQYIRSISKNTTADILIKLSYETWDTTFTSNDINIMFNSFLNTYLRTFYSSFPLKKIQKKSNNWITAGIKTSCNRKRELYLLSRNSYNPDLKKYYKLYCKS
jgi:hypothetical protein